MQPRKLLTLVEVVALTVVMTLLLLTGLTYAQGSDQPQAPTGPTTIAPGAIPVQGRLTDASGNPLNGTYTLTFRLYDVDTGGTALCSQAHSVGVQNGLFNSYLDNCYNDVWGQKLWFSVQVNSDPEMTPRQVIMPVPYALSLVPGAVISTGTVYPVLEVVSTHSTGRAVRAYALATTGANYAFVGASSSPDGYGGYFYDDADGVGVYGRGNSGVVGEGHGTYANGVFGHAGPLGAGVKGEGDLLGYGGWFTSTDQPALYVTSGEENTSDAIIVDGATDNGVDFRVATNGTVKQALTSSGLVKAGVYLNCGTGVGVTTRYFNNAGGVINVTGTAAGACTINFGFNVFDRYFVATSASNSARFVSCYTEVGTPNELKCHNWDAAGTALDGAIMVMVY